MPTGGAGTRPADAGPATCSCSGGHPPATAVAAADTTRPDTNCPDTDLVDTDRGSGSSSGQPRRPRCPVPQPPRHRPKCPATAGRRRTAAAVAARGQDRACRIARLRWSSGQIDAANGERLSGCLDTGRGLGEQRKPARPGTADTRDRRRAWDTAAAATLDSRQPNRPPPGSHVRSNRTPMCGTAQHARLTTRSVAWWSASIWSAPDRSSLLTLDGSSVQTALDGFRRIVWMIKAMINCRPIESRMAGRPGRS